MFRPEAAKGFPDRGSQSAGIVRSNWFLFALCPIDLNEPNHRNDSNYLNALNDINALNALNVLPKITQLSQQRYFPLKVFRDHTL